MGIHAGVPRRKLYGSSKGRFGVVTAQAEDAPIATGRPSAQLTVGFLALAWGGGHNPPRPQICIYLNPL